MSKKKKSQKIKSVDKNDIRNYTMETQLIYGKPKNPKWDYDHQLVPPVSSSTTFRLDSAERGAEGFKEFANLKALSENKLPIYIYDRLGEPNKEILEEHLAYAEKGETCVTFSSGMAAISAIICVLTKAGDEIVTHRTLYGCTFSLMKNWLPRFNIKARFVDLMKIKELEKAINENTKVVYFETPVNPTLDIIDIGEIRKVVDRINQGRKENNKISIVVDNTFATPFCQRPLELGADFVVHSLTKNIGGFGTEIGGAVISPLKYKPQILLFRKDFGGVLNNKSAWSLLVYGIPTLSLRLSRQQSTALEVAKYLSSHPKVQEVHYPGLDNFYQKELAKKQMVDYHGNFAPGSMIYFVIKGKTPKERQKNGAKFINYIAKNAYTITLAVSLGNIRTLIEHPGSMTHSAIPPEEQLKDGMDPGGIRLSIGLENANDILSDFKKAFKIL